MFDDHDFEDVALFADFGTGLIGAIIFLIILAIAAVILYNNHQDCAQIKCEHGEPQLLNHTCLCVEKPE